VLRRVCDLETSRLGAPYIYDTSNLRVNWGIKHHVDDSSPSDIQIINKRRGTARTLPNFCVVMYCLFCVVLCIVCLYVCTVLLSPGGYPIAVKYIIPYYIKNFASALYKKD
jgi:hypothetical protein